MLKLNFKQVKSLFNLNQCKAFTKDELIIDEEEVERCYSTTDDNYYSFNDDYFQKDFNEEILIEISKKQCKLNDYSNKGVAYSSREIFFNWVEKVINCLNIDLSNRLAIYYRFTMIYDYIMEKKYMTNTIITCDKELKKTIVTIFLIAYKLEGHSIGKITISNLINAFLKALNINQQRLSEEIRVMEVKVLKLLNYDCSTFDNNQYCLTSIILTLVKNRFGLSSDIIQLIEDILTRMTKVILLSGKSLFDIYPIDTAAIALCASVQHLLKVLEKESSNMTKYSLDDSLVILGQMKEITYMSDELYNYLNDELKVLKISLGKYRNFAKVFSELEI